MIVHERPKPQSQAALTVEQEVSRLHLLTLSCDPSGPITVACFETESELTRE